jgi:hypothetical protein
MNELKLIRKIDHETVARELQELAREHAIAAHVDEVLETHELYDQDSEGGGTRLSGAHAQADPGYTGPAGETTLDPAEITSLPPSELYDQDAEGGILGPICDEPFHVWQRFEICTVCGSAALVVDE